MDREEFLAAAAGRHEENGFTVVDATTDSVLWGAPGAALRIRMSVELPDGGTREFGVEQYFVQDPNHTMWIFAYTMPFDRVEELVPVVKQCAESFRFYAESE